jgi:hypothetical protein
MRARIHNRVLAWLIVRALNRAWRRDHSQRER